MVASYLLVAFARGRLLFEARSFQQGVLAEAILHSEHGVLQLAFGFLALPIGEQAGGGQSFGYYIGESDAHAPDGAGFVHCFVEKI